jgi:hypothetical protein
LTGGAVEIRNRSEGGLSFHLALRRGELACLAIRLFVGCALIIPMIIQTIGLDLSGAVWTDGASNLSRPDPS